MKWINSFITPYTKDLRKLSVGIVIALFMIVTTFHVGFYAASFEQDTSAVLSWPFALAVDLAIIVCSFFTKYIVTSKPAWVGYFTFTLMSGAMNIGWVQPGWNIAAISYALFPTLAIALLGWLFRQVDKLPSKNVKVVESNRKSRKIPVEVSTFPAPEKSTVHEVMEKYGVKKSRAYEILKEEKVKLNGHRSY